MDCRGDELIQHNNRASSAQAVPFQYLINEQAKSILALQELQNEVGALLEFRDLVMDTFPHLRQKRVSSPEPSSGSQGAGENRWEPGVRVRRKLGSSSSSAAAAAGWMAAAVASAAPRSRSYSHGGGKGPKSGEPGGGAASSVGTVQDSGFCTESKDSSSTSSRTTMTTKNGGCGGKEDEEDDELWSLLEVIQDKGTRLKLEVEFLRGRLLRDDRAALVTPPPPPRERRRCRSLESVANEKDWCGERTPDFRCDYAVFRAREADLTRERDALLDRVTEMEAESLSSAAQIHRLLAELKSVVCENRELEERLLSASAAKSSSHNGGGGGGGCGFAPVQPESSCTCTGPSSSSAGRDAFYTPSQHSACNLSSIELRKPCSPPPPPPSASSYADDDRCSGGRSRMQLLQVRPPDPISRNLDGRLAPSPPPPVLDIGSPTFAKRLGALDGIVSSPADRIGKCGAAPLDKRVLAAILKTFNPVELQRHLITVSYENTNLVRQVETLTKSKNETFVELNRSKEDNEELKFQLEEKRIELEGTMARVRLLQLHQEQQQHGPVVVVAATPKQQQQQQQQQQSSGTAANQANQWLDLVPSNPILPQIALPGTPSAAPSHPGHHHPHMHGHHQHQHQHQQDLHENGGGSSTESAHQARGGGGKPSKIPVVKSSHSVPTANGGCRPYRDPYPSWNKCKSDQSLPRNWEPINNNNNNLHHNNRSGSSSIGSSAGKQRGGSGKSDSLQQQQQQQDSCNGGAQAAGKLQQQHHRTSRRDSGSGGGTSLTRAKSQNGHYHHHHHQQQQQQQRAAASANSGKDRAGGATATAIAVAAASSTDDTNKTAAKKLLFRRRNLARQGRCLMDNKKTVLPAVDEVQEPPDSMAVREQQQREDGDDEDAEFFFDSIESSLATSAASSRRLPPECDSIDLSQPDSSLQPTTA